MWQFQTFKLLGLANEYVCSICTVICESLAIFTAWFFFGSGKYTYLPLCNLCYIRFLRLHIFIYTIWWVYFLWRSILTVATTLTRHHSAVFGVVCNAIHVYALYVYTNEDTVFVDYLRQKKMELSPLKCWRVECRGHIYFQHNNVFELQNHRSNKNSHQT